MGQDKQRSVIVITLGSLFSGSGGFELAGALSGIEPVWASEIEPFPIRVTEQRFPHMEHLGDIRQIDGGKIRPVDVITFGSPCTDLSIAGNREGLGGARSSLFYEAIRIIKEMRNATNGKYPRFAVWENVPNAFSVHKGEDFRVVLQSFCDVAGSGHTVPVPAKHKWHHAGAVVGDGFSIAWRVYEAQYWSTAQRRKRIYLIADFGSERAGEILFEPEGVSWNLTESPEAWRRASRYVQGGTGRALPGLADVSGGAYGCMTHAETATGSPVPPSPATTRTVLRTTRPSS